MSDSDVCVNKEVCVGMVRDRDLKIVISDEELACNLKKYDTLAPIGLLERNDLKLHDAVDEDVALSYFQSVVVDEFVMALAIDPDQAQSVKMFFNLYNRLKAAKEVVDHWKKIGEDGGLLGNELEFNPIEWEHDVLPYITGEGVLSNANVLDLGIARLGSATSKGVGYQISKEFSEVIGGVVGAGHVKKQGGGGGCAERKAYMVIATDMAPEIIQNQVRDAIVLYNGIVEYLDGYRDIECEGDCPDEDEFKVFHPIRAVDIAG